MNNWYYNEGYRDISDLVGKTIVDVIGLEKDSDQITFVCDDGSEYLMYHKQDCCESVYVNDVCGDVSDLIGGLVTEAREETNSEDSTGIEYPDSFTWTFYHIQTTKGHVVIRWLGESNGYYSESVDFKLVNKGGKL